MLGGPLKAILLEFGILDLSNALSICCRLTSAINSFAGYLVQFFTLLSEVICLISLTWVLLDASCCLCCAWSVSHVAMMDISPPNKAAKNVV